MSTPIERGARAIYLTELPDGDPLCVALEPAAEMFGCENAEQMRAWIEALTKKAAANVLAAFSEPSDAMVEDALSAWYASSILPNRKRTPWHSGMSAEVADDCRKDMRAALTAALQAAKTEGRGE